MPQGWGGEGGVRGVGEEEEKSWREPEREGENKKKMEEGAWVQCAEGATIPKWRAFDVLYKPI